MTRSFLTLLAAAAVLLAPAAEAYNGMKFNRIATFPVFLNNAPELASEETVAEIVTAANDGTLLIYTDGAFGDIGFVDITDPANPQPDGKVSVSESGEPTSVAAIGQYALVAIDTSTSKTDVSGQLVVVDIGTRSIVRTIELNGQPDAIDIAPDGQRAAVAIENERDEDLCVGGSDDGLPIVDDEDYMMGENTTEDLCEDNDGVPGAMPQTAYGNPPGELVILDISGAVGDWAVQQRVTLTGLANLYPTDPEPEYVDINENNIALVTLQENNHIVLVNIVSGRVENDFSAGTTNLTHIDTVENSLIEATDSQRQRLREPDGAAWLGHGGFFATADEGDLNGGSRGFTIYDATGRVAYQPRNRVERLVTRIGHYPEERSENKGNEPENVAYGRFGKTNYLFVGSERSSVVVVYRLSSFRNFIYPVFQQVLPAGVGPEGIIAIPERQLLIAASEVDDRGDKIRSGLNIYQLQRANAEYPTLYSLNEGAKPIPWGAQSALATDARYPWRLYSVYDSFYDKSRIFTIDSRPRNARITRQLIIRDSNGLLAAAESAPFVEVDEFCQPIRGVEQRLSLAKLVNDDGTVNLDPEGVDVARGGGFYVASEGNGNLVCQEGDLRVSGASEVAGNRPFNFPNLIVKVDRRGAIVDVIQLPDAVAQEQARFGFEGVTARMEGGTEILYVAFQRNWDGARNNNGDPSGPAAEQRARIGRYDTSTREWTFLYYDLAEPTSPNGGWVGLSEIVDTGNGNEFAVIERDNQGGPDASIKTIVTFTAAPADFVANDDLSESSLVSNQTLSNDLMDELQAPGGLVQEKVEGLTVLGDGYAAIVTDNDGVDDASGETQFQRVMLRD